MPEQPISEIHKTLCRLQSGMAEVKTSLRDLKADIISVKQQLHTMQGDNLRQEHTIAGIHLDLNRIKTRLDLSDA